MAQVINTNIASLNAQRNLNSSQTSLATSLQRLSSGLRINSAKDDAAGLAISERFTAQIRGLDQAVRNSNDGISLAQTAESSLGEVTNNLQRIRELAVQSANATNSTSDRAALQAEVSQLIEEINRVSSQSNFNGVALLDGTFADQSFQVGANVGDTIILSSIVNTTSDGLGLTNVVASVSSGTVGATAGGGDLTINGIDIAASTDADDLVTKIGATVTDVTAAVTGNTTGSLGAFTAVTGASAAATYGLSVGGVDIYATTTLSAGGITAADVDTQLEDSTVVADLAAAGIVQTAGTSAAAGNLTFTTSNGAQVDVIEALSTGTANGFASVAGGTLNDSGTGVTLTSTAGVDIVIGGTDPAAGGFTAGTSLAQMNVSTQANANSLITAIDAALDKVNGSRATLGAVQNRFESVVASLQTASESMSAARSRIMDTDFASETANMTRAQILMQAGTSMLAQANQLPQNVLSLLGQ